jgi:hypothetical protein
MLADLASIPGAGGLAAAGILYAGVSLFVTGPLVAERSIDKSRWVQHCVRQAKATTQPPATSHRPGLDCTAIFGAIYGSEGAAYCARHGGALALPFAMLDGLAAQPGETLRRRAADQAARVQSACTCAVAIVMETRRMDFALHAGTARLVTPMPVRGLTGELDRALSSPACSAKG